VLAASGLLGYLGYVGWRTGTPTGWFDIQRTGWGSQFDAGASLARFVGRALSTGHELYDLAVLLTLIGSLVLLVVAVRMRLPWPLLVYTAAVLITVWCSDGQVHSRVAPADSGVPAAASRRARARPAPHDDGGRGRWWRPHWRRHGSAGMP
jgi:hypothetical protein